MIRSGTLGWHREPDIGIAHSGRRTGAVGHYPAGAEQKRVLAYNRTGRAGDPATGSRNVVREGPAKRRSGNQSISTTERGMKMATRKQLAALAKARRAKSRKAKKRRRK